jgi:hypothetical protein
MKRPVEYPVIRDGQPFLLPKNGGSYEMICCDCQLAHKIFNEITRDGVQLRVYRDETETQRLRQLRDGRFTADSASSPSGPGKVQTMRTRRRYRDDNADAWEDTIGLDGKPTKILKDGRTARFNFFDAQSSRDANNARIAEAIKVTEAAIILSGSQFTDAQLAAHRPGFRYADANGDNTYSQGNAPGGKLPDDEWERHERRRRRSKRWVERDPMGRLSGEISEEENDHALDGLTPSELARAEMIMDTSNAWRNPVDQIPVQDDLLKTVPPRGGFWPLSTGIGTPCDRDGERGTLQLDPEGSGFLVCQVAQRVAPTRSGTSKPSLPGTDSMTAEAAQPIRDQAYQTYLDELHSAWRK